MAKKKSGTPPEQNTLTAEELKRYKSGEMTGQEMNRVEKILLERPFYADALDGREKLEEDRISVSSNLADLKNRLQHRIKEPGIRATPAGRSIGIWKTAGIAAVLVLMFSGVYYWLNEQPQQIQTAIVGKQDSPPQKLTEPDVSPPEIKTDKTENLKTERNQPELQEKGIATDKNTVSQTETGKRAEEQKISDTKSTPKERIETTVAPIQAIVTATEEKKTIAEKEYVEENTGKINNGAGIATASVTAKVINDDHEPMKDVAVHIKGKTEGVKTDEDGKFNLKNARRGDVVVFNSLTMPQMELPVKSVQTGRVVYSEQNISIQSKPKISVSSPNELMFEKTAMDARPEYGWEAFDLYLKENTRQPPAARKLNVNGRVIVGFVINENGQLSDFSIIKSLGSGCDEEAIRLVKNGPKWFPATKDEKPVSSTRQVVVRFK